MHNVRMSVGDAFVRVQGGNLMLHVLEATAAVTARTVFSTSLPSVGLYAWLSS